MKKHFNKLLSIVLSIITLCSLSSQTLYIYANSIEPLENGIFQKELKDSGKLQQELDELTYEIVELREENVKNIRTSDGTYLAVAYGYPIHRLNVEGIWEEIDNTLKLEGDNYTTSDSRFVFSKDLTKDKIAYSVKDRDYQISVRFSNLQQESTAYVDNIEIDENELSKLDKIKNISKISSRVMYHNVINGVDLEYDIFSNSIKENIIINEQNSITSYDFIMELEGLYAELLDGKIELIDISTNEIVYCIPAPYMYDAANNISYEIWYELEKTSNNSYKYTVNISAEWLQSQERVYPITIDPTLVDIAQTDDTYVNSSSSNTNYGDNGEMYVSSGQEAYYLFTTPNLPEDTMIISASIELPYYFTYNNGTSITVSVYQITSLWTENNVTWNTKPSTSATSLDSDVLYSNSQSYYTPEYVIFGVTNYVQSWYSNGNNYGFAIKYTSGTGSDVIFIPKESSEQVYAQLTITYTGNDLAEGVYTIENSVNGCYIESGIEYNSTTKQYEESIYQNMSQAEYEYGNLFKITYRTIYHDYIIRSMVDNSLVIYPNIADMSLEIESNCNSDFMLAPEYAWDIDYINGQGYKISYSYSGLRYYLKSTSNYSNVSLVLTTNGNDSGILWDMDQYTGGLIEDINVVNFKNHVTVGESYEYDARAISSRIGVIGDVYYSVVGNSASINPTTGVITGVSCDTAILQISFIGAIYTWSASIDVWSAGDRAYLSITSNNDLESEYRSWNCQAYAFNTSNTDNSWFINSEIVDLGVSITSNELLKGIDINQNHIKGLKEEFEDNWLSLNSNIVSWCDVTMYTDDGWDILLNDTNHNQWIVAFRVISGPLMDYHFWYRTNSGRWSHKQGYNSISHLLDYGDLPTNNTSEGWYIEDDYYYDSDVIYYLITTN